MVEPPGTSTVIGTLHTLGMTAFVKVRGGSLRLNHPEVAHRYPRHPVPPVKMLLGKVRYSRTTPNSCERHLHTLLSLH